MDNYFVLGCAVLFGIIIGRLSKQSDPMTQSQLLTQLPPGEIENRIRNLVNANKKIEAIKLLRLNSNLGLKEAKDLVDDLALGKSGKIAGLISDKRSDSIR